MCYVGRMHVTAGLYYCDPTWGRSVGTGPAVPTSHNRPYIAANVFLAAILAPPLQMGSQAAVAQEFDGPSHSSWAVGHSKYHAGGVGCGLRAGHHGSGVRLDKARGLSRQLRGCSWTKKQNYGDRHFISKPGRQSPKPSSETLELGFETAKPNHDSSARARSMSSAPVRFRLRRSNAFPTQGSSELHGG